jgi:MoxR-like ATPase
MPMVDRKSQPLTRAEVERMVESVRALLDDPDAGLSREARLRWQGVLVALDTVLGRVTM